MSNRKKSFFERLTGSVDTSDDYREYNDFHGESEDGRGYNDFNNDFSGGGPQSQRGQQHDDGWNNPGYNEYENNAEQQDEGELAVDVYETPEHVVVQAMVAGVRPDQLEVSITREMCTIGGRREAPHDANRDEYMTSELYWGSFSRSIILPSEVEVEESEASENHGLLTIRLPKINKDQETKLEVHSG